MVNFLMSFYGLSEATAREIVLELKDQEESSASRWISRRCAGGEPYTAQQRSLRVLQECA
jgi:hypothetical protein